MALLRHDSQGFLTGEAIDIGRSVSALNDIRADVRAIRQAVMGASKSGRRALEASADRTVRPVVTPGLRDNLGRFVRREASGAPPTRQRAAARAEGKTRGYTAVAPAIGAGMASDRGTSSIKSATAEAWPESSSGRDERGRFSGGVGGGEPNAAGEGVLRSFLDRLTGLASATGGTLEGADPAVKAFQEVAQPLARGYGMLAGNREEKRKEGWFRRIYSSLAGFRKDESVFNKASNKSLKNLEDRPAAVGSASGGGIFSSILPMLGALFSRLILPIGAAILGWNVGKWIGEKLYAWMDEKGINTIIFDAFDGAKKWISESWDSAILTFGKAADWISKSWDSIVSVFKSAYEGLKSLPVIGAAIQAAEALAKKATEAAAPVVATVKQNAKDATAGAKQAYTGESQAGAGRGSINPPMAGSTEPLDTRSTAFKAGEVAGGAAKAGARAYGVMAASAGSVLESVMPKGYRHKALFDGIKGAGALEKYGSYTDDEAKKIQELKASGANTSANLKGGMPVEIQDKIAAQAKKAGLDPVMMQKIAAMESGGNVNAVSSTGASGIYQFTGKTASGVGIKDRFDADQNIEGGMRLTKQNVTMLESAKLPVSAENLYMMHQLGPQAAREVIRGAANGKSKADMSSDTQKAMNLNYGANSKTASDYIAANKKALDERYDLTVAKNSTVSTVPVAPSAPAAPAPAQSVFAPAPKAPSFSAPPPIADAPPVIDPLGTSADSKRPIIVTLPAQDVGQDVSHRGIAHNVTGGLSR